MSSPRAAEVLSNEDMQVAELNSEYLGVTNFQLMEAVGAKAASEIIARMPKGKPNPKVHVFSGPGKNGGDGFSIARHLTSMGLRVKVTLVSRTAEVNDYAARQQLTAILQMKESVEFEAAHDSSQLKAIEAELIVDSLLGTGVKGPLREPLLGAVRALNKSRGFKVAVDIPSGLDTDTGEPHGDAVKADLTICLHKTKKGLLEAKQYVGTLVVLPIGIPLEAELFTGPGDFKVLWKPRPDESRKGDFGRLLVIGGSENFTGAPAFAALAATKIGTDLVYVAAPQKTAEIITSYSPDLISIKLPGEHLSPRALPELSRWTSNMDAIVLGPGIGIHDETADSVWKLISEAESLKKPLVLDADALKVFGRRRRKLRTPCIITPHAGEFAAVAQRKLSSEIELNKEAAAQLAKELGSTVVLKGHVDIIANADGRVRLNRTGNPYMTVGGTGDILSGLAGGLLAQHVEPFRAGCAAVFLNGLAGDIMISEKVPTITPSALVDYLPKAMRYCIEGPPYPAISK